MFGGGTACLKLVENDSGDKLGYGVDIEAEPPGKALQNIQLLSGGEKTLTSIAIIISIMKLRPMPFCLLDEIESALDEVNTVRFAKYIQNFPGDTQFIMVTHKKITMEAADAIFGVTMQFLRSYLLNCPNYLMKELLKTMAFGKYEQGLKKTKISFWAKLKNLFVGKVSDDFYDELETVLISSDISVLAADEVVENLRDYALENSITDTSKLIGKLKEELIDILDENGVLEYNYPLAIMMVGVNGVGKTTTIGKLANYFKSKGKSVVVAAADTFRAAAKEQLSVWADKNGVRIIKGDEGTDPSSVVFDAVSSATSRKTDVLIIDTAGRLHNKANLMEELKKMNRVLRREFDENNIYNFIVIDAITGQNALSQVKAFDEAVNIDGVVLTKLDGTAKGGIAITLSKDYSIPIAFIGVGEGMDDLQEFDSEKFVNAIFDN